MSFPLTGETVKCKYLEIDELEAKVLLLHYNKVGYLSNHNLIPSMVGETDTLTVSGIDHKRGIINLKK